MVVRQVMRLALWMQPRSLAVDRVGGFGAVERAAALTATAIFIGDLRWPSFVIWGATLFHR